MPLHGMALASGGHCVDSEGQPQCQWILIISLSKVHSWGAGLPLHLGCLHKLLSRCNVMPNTLCSSKFFPECESQSGSPLSVLLSQVPPILLSYCS
jgi:hypothetical protein